MNSILAFLQGAEANPTNWNYIVLGVLIVLAVILGVNVMKKRQKEV